jgi:hypothetical protein
MAAFAMMGLLLWMNMVPSLDVVTSWLDESTLGLLFGMMILVGQLKNTGLFEVLCSATLKACRGNMWLLSMMRCYLTGRRGGGGGWRGGVGEGRAAGVGPGVPDLQRKPNRYQPSH